MTKYGNVKEELADMERRAGELHHSILNDTDGNTPDHHQKVSDYRELMEKIETLKTQIQ